MASIEVGETGMSDLTTHLAGLRRVMAAFPPLESHTPQTPLEPADIYFPKSHAAALDPDRSLVIGNRGMGKSYWASALVKPESRNRIAKALPEARLDRSEIDVRFGFAEGEGAVGISRDELAKFIQKGFPVEQIWRAVTLPGIAEHAGHEIPNRLADRLDWVANEPGEVREIMRAADAKLADNRGKLVFVFDQLEQLADDLDLRSKLTEGILRLALAFKSYRGLRIKIFMRTDHFAETKLFAFPDASKIRGDAVYLDWRSVDVYGLLYTRLFRNTQPDFTAIARQAELPSIKNNILPDELTANEESQRRVFDVIAGDAMGGRKRGLPYTWLVSHLADAHNQVSPRTFLMALKFAAENTPAPNDKAIDHFGIQEGVRKASVNRIDDLKWDYPWVPPALYALKGLLVPCLPEEMIGKWQGTQDLMRQLRAEVPSGEQPEWLAASDEVGLTFYKALQESMADIGVMEIRRTTGKVDVPDIFRIPAGIKRKGGITQQQRRKARMPVATEIFLTPAVPVRKP
jgi:hypothetical protein